MANDRIHTRAKFKRTDEGFQITVLAPRTIEVAPAEMGVALNDLGLAAEGELETKIFQLATGQEISLDVDLTTSSTSLFAPARP